MEYVVSAPPVLSVRVIVPGVRFTRMGDRTPFVMEFPWISAPGHSTSAFGFSATNCDGTWVML